jgi:hypothetical protein
MLLWISLMRARFTLVDFQPPEGKGDRSNLPEWPATKRPPLPGCAQIGPVPFVPLRGLGHSAHRMQITVYCCI